MLKYRIEVLGDGKNVVLKLSIICVFLAGSKIPVPYSLILKEIFKN